MKVSNKKAIATVLLSCLIAGFSSIAYGVHPQTWTSQVEQDYTDGTFANVVVNNYGELTLGRELKHITVPAGISFINGFAQGKDGTMYCVSYVHGKVYKITGDHADEFFTPPADHPDLLSIAADGKGDLLVGACGDTAELLRISTDAAGKVVSQVAFTDPAVSSIWAIVPMADGTLYLGTGGRGDASHGQVWKVPAAGKAAAVLDVSEKNVLSLIADAKGNLIAGTDGEGLVIRLDGKTLKPFVLLDAGPVDITALAGDGAGNIYAAAGQPVAPSEQGPSEEPSPPSKPGKVEPEVPDTAPAPEPADDGSPAAPTPMKQGAEGAQGPGAAGLITLPGDGILAQNAPPDILKKLMAKLKADDPAMPPGAPHKQGGDGGGPSSEQQQPKNGPGGEGSEEVPANIVYKIAPDGVVSSLVHLQDTLLSLLYHDGELLIGTGDEGKLYSSKPASETKALIARVSDENVMSLVEAADGTVYVGTSDDGEIYTLLPQQAPHGTYVSKVLNAGNLAAWGAANVTATIPDGAKATIATRSGNVADVENQGNLWNDWSDEIPANSYKAIGSPAARFLQYRVTLDANPKGETPTVAQTRIVYELRNLPPVIKNVAMDTSGDSGVGGGDDADVSPKPAEPSHVRHIYWDASDPNHDELAYRVLYRQVGTDLWVEIAKDLKDPQYDWNTKEVADGKYQIKVIASDAPDNTPEEAKAVARVTAVFTINNTPPTISELKAVQGEDKSLTITGHADDGVSPITDVRYQVDGHADWRPANASNKMFDSPSEGFSVVTRPLYVGEHRVTVKATDAQGNVSYKAVTVTVK